MSNESFGEDSLKLYTTSENIETGRASEYFIFYDPFYEDLAKRAKTRRDPLVLRNLQGNYETTAINRDSPNEGLTMGLGRSSKLVPESASLDSDEEIAPSMKSVCISQVSSPKKQTVPLVGQDAVIASLYVDIDRLRTEVDRLLAKELLLTRQISKQADLEVKYLNALRLLDELNWKLNGLEDPTK